MKIIKNEFMDLQRCARELNVSLRWMRRLFRRTKFDPVLVINNKPFFLRHDFERWKAMHNQSRRDDK